MNKTIYNKKKILLIILSICFIVTLIFRLIHPFKQQTVSELTYTTKKNYSGKTIPSDKELFLLFDLLENKKIKIKKDEAGLIKDIFCDNKDEKKNQSKDKPVIIETKKPIIKKPDIKELIKNEFRNYQFFGFLIENGNITIFIDRNKDILTVRSGDIIDGKYKVISITEDFIQIKPIDIDENIIIDISNLKS